MRRTLLLSIIVVIFTTGFVWADTFGTGTNQLEIQFVPISGDASSINGAYIGKDKPEGFVDPGYNYRMGVYEITNSQWGKFSAEYGTVYGSPDSAYCDNPYWTGANVPTNMVSWHEAAQFVNWLNTSTGHHAAYKFTGTQGTSDYKLGVWKTSEAWGGTNLYRHKDAFYFLPTEEEWVKAAYWNGASLQTYATQSGDRPPQGYNEWNYYDSYNGYATYPYGPWDVGSGSEELNGTFDMMGNVWEWTESPSDSGTYLSGADRNVRGGSFAGYDVYSNEITLSYRIYINDTPYFGVDDTGFRVASIPEPASALIIILGAAWIKRKG